MIEIAGNDKFVIQPILAKLGVSLAKLSPSLFHIFVEGHKFQLELIYKLSQGNFNINKMKI
jgi:hypothetical protein